MQMKTEERARAIHFREEGWSVKEIARELRISTGSVSVWVRGIRLGSVQRERLAEREWRGGERGRQKILARWRKYRKLHPKPLPELRPARLVESFFNTWSPEMAYVLGYFAADGCMYRNPRGSYYVQFTSCDLQLIQLVRRLLGCANAIEVQKRAPPRKTGYTLQIGSRALFERLCLLGFTPAKSLTLKFPAVPQKVLADFVRGYFDGDGCVSYGRYWRKARRTFVRHLFVQFVSGSRMFLEKLHTLLRESGAVRGGHLGRHSRSFHLQYSGRDVLRLYAFLYPRYRIPCLRRKQEKFQSALQFFGPVEERPSS